MDTSISTELAPYPARNNMGILTTILVIALVILTYYVAPPRVDHEAEKRMKALEEMIHDLVTSVRELSDAEEEHEKRMEELKAETANRLAVLEEITETLYEARGTQEDDMAEAIGRLFVTLQELQGSVAHLVSLDLAYHPEHRNQEHQTNHLRARSIEISHNVTSSMSAYDTLNSKITEYLRETPKKTVSDVFKHIRESEPNITRHDINSRLYNLLNRGRVVKTIGTGSRPYWMLK